MSEDNTNHSENSAPKIFVETQETSTINDTTARKVLVVGRNKDVPDEEFDMRDKSQDRGAAEVWSILKMLMADQQKYSEKPNGR